jgi:hypothetical protein
MPGNLGHPMSPEHMPQQPLVVDMRLVENMRRVARVLEKRPFFEYSPWATPGNVGALVALHASLANVERLFCADAFAGSGTGAHAGIGGVEEGAQRVATEALTKRVDALEAQLRAAGEAAAAQLSAAAEATAAQRVAAAEAELCAAGKAAAAQRVAAAEAERRAAGETAGAKRVAAAAAKRRAAGKQLAFAEAQRRASGEAAAAKRLAAAETKRRAVGEAATAKRLSAAETKQRAAGEAATAKRLAAAETQRRAGAGAATAQTVADLVAAAFAPWAADLHEQLAQERAGAEADAARRDAGLEVAGARVHAQLLEAEAAVARLRAQLQETEAVAAKRGAREPVGGATEDCLVTLRSGTVTGSPGEAAAADKPEARAREKLEEERATGPEQPEKAEEREAGTEEKPGGDASTQGTPQPAGKSSPETAVMARAGEGEHFTEKRLGAAAPSRHDGDLLSEAAAQGRSDGNDHQRWQRAPLLLASGVSGFGDLGVGGDDERRRHPAPADEGAEEPQPLGRPYSGTPAGAPSRDIGSGGLGRTEEKPEKKPEEAPAQWTPQPARKSSPETAVTVYPHARGRADEGENFPGPMGGPRSEKETTEGRLQLPCWNRPSWDQDANDDGGDSSGSGGCDPSWDEDDDGGGGDSLVEPGGWAVLVENDAWKGLVVLVLGPGKGCFAGLTKVMHIDGTTYHVWQGGAWFLRPCEPSPAVVPAPMRLPLLRTRTGGAALLRLRELINGLKAECAGGNAAASTA